LRKFHPRLRRAIHTIILKFHINFAELTIEGKGRDGVKKGGGVGEGLVGG
jgi:hypothetical protein